MEGVQLPKISKLLEGEGQGWLEGSAAVRQRLAVVQHQADRGLEGGIHQAGVQDELVLGIGDGWWQGEPGQADLRSVLCT